MGKEGGAGGWGASGAGQGAIRWTTLAEGVDVIILIRKRQRRRGYSVHTSGGGGLPDLISFSSKLARIRDNLSHQVDPDVGREKETFDQETFILVNSVGQRSKEHIFPIKVEGFLSAAKVSDMNA